ncbi:MAG: hypothetical protein ACO3RV_06840 [Luteolibacter sp.]
MPWAIAWRTVGAVDLLTRISHAPHSMGEKLHVRRTLTALDCGEDRRFRAGIGVRPASKAAILAALQVVVYLQPVELE